MHTYGSRYIHHRCKLHASRIPRMQRGFLGVLQATQKSFARGSGVEGFKWMKFRTRVRSGRMIEMIEKRWLRWLKRSLKRWSFQSSKEIRSGRIQVDHIWHMKSVCMSQTRMNSLNAWDFIHEECMCVIMFECEEEDTWRVYMSETRMSLYMYANIWT